MTQPIPENGKRGVLAGDAESARAGEEKRDAGQARGFEVGNGAAPSLNEVQRLRLRTSCEYMDKLLQQVEAILHAQESASPFSRYRMDLNPAQARVIEDYIRRYRSQLLRAMAWQHMQPPPPEIPATRAISVNLSFLDITISDLRPNAMRGSGPVDESVAAELTGILGELSSLTGQMMGYMKNELGESLRERIGKISGGDDAEGAAALLERIEKVVTARGMVEFRPRIDLLLERMEDPTFEVAVFGRVSSGKSSFLNALLGADLLPVGANPVTAVPTRIQHGAQTGASVRFSSREFEDVSLERFRELISEAGNPGNAAGVRKAVVRTQAARLSEGIVLVDTPGLGSLAVKGTRETLAYLPACDLALLLIDAGNTLTLEDIGTLRLIHEAGIEALVLLSKADLLSEPDRVASVAYIKAQVGEQLHVAVTVDAISSLKEYTGAIDGFYEQELRPRFQQNHMLRMRSVEAKLLRLRTDVIASLQAQARRTEAVQPMSAAAIERMETMLMNTAGQLGTMDRTLEDRILHLGFEAPEFIEAAAKESSDALLSGESASMNFSESTRRVREMVQREVAKAIELLQATMREAIVEVQGVGRELGLSQPDEAEIVGLIRDAPRFELAEVSGAIDLGVWKMMGRGMIHRRVLGALQEAVQPALHNELMDYAPLLGVWAKNLNRELRFSLNSFADAYRAALQDARQPNGPAEGAEQLRKDIAMLMAGVSDEQPLA